jgi:hypothetical protein
MSAQDEAAPCGYFAMSRSYSRKLLCSAIPNISDMDKSGRFEIGQDSSLLASSSPKTDGCGSVMSTPTLPFSACAGSSKVPCCSLLVADTPLQRNDNHRREV